MPGPTLPFSAELHQQKYRAPGESFEAAMARIAGALGEPGEHRRHFLDTLEDMRFLPAGRIQSAVGATRATTPYNCYVSGGIEDSFVEGEGSIMARALEAAATMRMGGGIGYDFSSLRPRGDLINKLQSQSSGPISFMEVYDAVCRCVASSGHRRGAQMGVLRVDHPDIEAFITAKQPPAAVRSLWDMVAEMPEGPLKVEAVAALQQTLRLTGFNLSVGVTDEFMRALRAGGGFDLRFNGRKYRTVDAGELWDLIMKSTWDWAEPGVLFLDTINRMNNLYYCERIVATNPCGEQPLPPNGACLLGSFNLVRYLRRTDSPTGSKWRFDWRAFEADIPVVVRAMDNVIDSALYPLEAQRREAVMKRRMGLGITGLANAAEALGHVYGSESFLIFENSVLRRLSIDAYLTSAELGEEKGSFPLFDKNLYLEGQFINTLSADVAQTIRRKGLRNSHLTSIAPTGTISLCADNVSSGIEPVFAHSFDRTVIEPTGPRVETVTDYGVAQLGVRGKTSDRVTVDEHLDVLIVAATCVDSAVSKTCNVGDEVSWTDFKRLYERAWAQGAKGCTTFRASGKRAGVLVAKKEDADPVPEIEVACRIDPQTGRRECE